MTSGLIKRSLFSASQAQVMPFPAAERKNPAGMRMAAAQIPSRARSASEPLDLSKFRLTTWLPTQEPDDDQRTRMVTLTNQGREALAAALPLWEEAQTLIVSGLGRERWNMLLPDLSDVVSLACEPYIFLS